MGPGFSNLPGVIYQNNLISQHVNFQVDTMCTDCERFFEDQKALSRHIRQTHTNKKPSFTCGECGASFPYPVLVDRHR